MEPDLDALAACVVNDEDGVELRVGELWRSRPAVIAWVRHFG